MNGDIPHRHDFVPGPKGKQRCSQATGSGFCLMPRSDSIHFPLVKPMHPKAEKPVATREFLRALGAASELSGGAAPDSEYARGQAELLCDLFGLDMNDNKELIIHIITKDVP